MILTKLHADVPWTNNQNAEIMSKLENSDWVNLELRSVIVESSGLVPGATIRIHKNDVYKSIGTQDRTGTYLTTNKVF